MKDAVVVWLRRDLRLADNPTILEALKNLIPGNRIFFVYILELSQKTHEETPATLLQNEWSDGAAYRAWLAGSLDAVSRNLDKVGGELLIFKGDPLSIIPNLCKELKINRVVWGRQYDSFYRDRDSKLKKSLIDSGVNAVSVNASLLLEPWEGVKADQSPYLVYTPFWRNLLQRTQTSEFTARLKQSLAPVDIVLQSLRQFRIARYADLVPSSWGDSLCNLGDLGLRSKLGWDHGFFTTEGRPDCVIPGEDHALSRLRFFLKSNAQIYNESRDIPAVDGTSKLSASLAHGEISPCRVWYELIERFGLPSDPKKPRGVDQFFKEVVWREFSYHLLYFFPQTPLTPLKSQFESFPWSKNYHKNLGAWKKGMTGYPIVDAGMRQLWQEGWMHNRVRMIVASFLIKHLLIPWQEGARWFWDTLVDADLASNTQGWQWTAGCGADASPFFRVFNPILQGEKFDPDGVYVKKYIPELKNLPTEWIHKPFECSSKQLADYGLTLGVDYPSPLVDHGEGRTRALLAYEQIRGHST